MNNKSRSPECQYYGLLFGPPTFLVHLFIPPHSRSYLSIILCWGCFSITFPLSSPILDTTRCSLYLQVPDLAALHGEQEQQAIEVSGPASAASLTEAVARNSIKIDTQDYPSCVLRGEEVRYDFSWVRE